MKGKWVRAAFWLLTGLAFAYDFYVWGGLANTPITGKELRDFAPMESALAATYLFVGGSAVSGAGLARPAVEFAGRRFPDVIADRESSPQTIVHRVLSAQSLAGRLAYYGAPLLLLLSLVLHVRRQKQIRSFGQ